MWSVLPHSICSANRSQIWYDLYAQNDLILRPILFGTVGLHGGSIGDLHMIQSPQYHNWVANSTGNVTSFFLRKDLIDTPRDVIFYNLDLNSVSSSSNAAKNTDGVRLILSSAPQKSLPIGLLTH
jgi:galacturan 1,4-alpha-galacturonidase